MSEPTLKTQIQHLRTEAETLFYTCGAFFETEEKSKAEKLAVKILIARKEREIDIHNEVIKLCEKAMNDNSKDSGGSFISGYMSGIHVANGARKKTHQNFISDLKKDIEILNLNLL